MNKEAKDQNEFDGFTGAYIYDWQAIPGSRLFLVDGDKILSRRRPKSILDWTIDVQNYLQLIAKYDSQSTLSKAKLIKVCSLIHPELEEEPRQTEFGILSSYTKLYQLTHHLSMEGYEWTPIRQIRNSISNGEFFVLARALHLIHWNEKHNICSKCGSDLVWNTKELAKNCSVCSEPYYPVITPAVIVRIERGDEILLAKHNRPDIPPFYSNIAGFVEAGESLEQTVLREIKEEVNLEVDGVTYLGSQPWPFPGSVMCAFSAQYKAGEIQIQEDEILEASFFPLDDLPEIPHSISISRRIIDRHLQEKGIL